MIQSLLKIIGCKSYSQLCEINTLFFNRLDNLLVNCNFINLKIQNVNYNNFLTFKSFNYFMPINIGILIATLLSSLFLIFKNNDLFSLRK